MDELIEIQGTVAGFFYKNEDDGYGALRIMTGDGTEIVSVGFFPAVNIGETITITGIWVENAKFGKQFKSSFYETVLPSDLNDIFDFLSSGTIKGIGPATASLLIQKYGRNVFDILENHPEELSTVKGIGNKKADEISAEFRKMSGVKKLTEYLCAYDIKPLYAMRLYKLFGNNALETVQENPYVLASEQVGSDFDSADKFAMNIGIDYNSDLRIKAAIIYELRHVLTGGHVFLPFNKLTEATSAFINCDPELIETSLSALIEEGEITTKDIAGFTACYLNYIYQAETDVCRRVRFCAENFSEPESGIQYELSQLEAQNGIEYTELQKKAISSAICNRMSVITGGPGTGKTTIINAVCSLFENRGNEVLLAAPTGRAAKRLAQVTGRKASTIHRMLEARPSAEDGVMSFMRDESDPLCCDVIIVDECSMVDLLLMRALLSAVPMHAKIVLVGDTDQLPPVGPGNVFSDIIRSKTVPVTVLNDIFRQAKESNIIVYAHKINCGEYPDFSVNSKGFFRLLRQNPEQARSTLTDLCSKRLPERMGLAQEDIQVLSPTRKGPLGTKALNMLLQEALNPQSKDKAEKVFYDTVFRVGDRVMQTKNNYDIQWSCGYEEGTGIFNGDIGYIVSLDTNMEQIIIDFDGKLAVYSFSLLNELEHAWAVTVHKAQGSEYKAVIFMMSDSVKNLMTRNILYTAVSRARDLLIVIGDDNNIRFCIDNNKVHKRYSGLKYRLCNGG